MPTYIIGHKGGRRRAGRSEDKFLGTIEAADEQEAQRLAGERWPGLRLLVYEQHIVQPTSPPRYREE
jgi:hypothetical protein